MNRIREGHDKITVEGNFKLRFYTKTRYPDVETKDIDQNLRNKIENALYNRYCQLTHSLDLTKFHRDSGK